MSQIAHRAERQPWKSCEPQPIVLPELSKRYTAAQIDAASRTTVINACPNSQACRSCGQSSEAGARFCGQCGTRLA